ncbi:MAG: ABC transporter ATP-binding protein [Opitutaceae bacterium]|jgi:putative ABC transport system ATP-binding protein
MNPNRMTQMEAPAFNLVQVEKSYRNGDVVTPVLRQVDFSAQAGEMLFLIGPSGCGKTTLLSILCGTLKADGGEINALGKALHRLSEREFTDFRAHHVGFIFQQFNLIPSLTVVENVALPLIIQNVSASKAAARACELLARVGLADKAAARTNQLSGGQQQRVAIARALVHDPQLVVCDEPTSALDSATGHQVMELLREGARGAQRTVIVATHDPRTYGYADRMAEMEDGRILRVLNTPEEIAAIHRPH